VETLDLAVESLDEARFQRADLIAFYVPMHTVTRLAAQMIAKVRGWNPTAHVAAYGLYAPMNEIYLRHLGVQTVLGGESEDGLAALAQRLTRGVEAAPGEQLEPRVSLARQDFVIPDREGLPSLDRYAYLRLPNGDRRTAGYVEAAAVAKKPSPMPSKFQVVAPRYSWSPKSKRSCMGVAKSGRGSGQPSGTRASILRSNSGNFGEATPSSKEERRDRCRNARQYFQTRIWFLGI